MNNLINKLKLAEKKLSEANGAFELFAIFLREDNIDKWDLLVSAPWIEKNKQIGLQKVANLVQSELTKEELVQLSRIIIIDKINKSLDVIHKAVNIEHGSVEIKDSNFFGLIIKHAFLITSKRII
jgi:hypothetical protein